MDTANVFAVIDMKAFSVTEVAVFEDAIKMAENGMRFNAREAAAFEDLIKEMDGDDYIEPNWTRTPYIAEKQKPCDNQAEQ